MSCQALQLLASLSTATTSWSPSAVKLSSVLNSAQLEMGMVA